MSAVSPAKDQAPAATKGQHNTQKPEKPAKKLQNTGSCTGTTKIDYCTEFASIKCSQSSHFLKLTIIPGMHRPTFGPMKHHGATVTDCIPEVNYPLFAAPWNHCFSIINPLVLAATTAKFAATGTWSTVPIPCCLGHVPLGNWGKSVGEMKVKFVPHFSLGFGIGTTIHNLRVSFLSNPEVDCLTKNCTLTCAWLGTISIVSSGRDETNIVPYGPIDGLMGPSIFDCLRNACGIIMNYTGLAGTIALSALDSVFAGVQTAIATGDPLEGLFAGLKTAAGYAIGFGIAAGAGKVGGAALRNTNFGKNLSSKISVKFNAFAQTSFVKNLNKLHVSLHKGTMSLGKTIGGPGKALVWLGNRNLYRVLEGRAKLLGDIRVKLNTDSTAAAERMARLEALTAQQGKLSSKMAPKYRMREILSDRKQRLKAENSADVRRQQEINDEINGLIDKNKDLYKMKDQGGSDSKYLDDKINENYAKMDDLAVEHAALDSKINHRNDQIKTIDDDIGVMNKSFNDDMQKMTENDAEINKLENSYGNDYNTKVTADDKISKIDDQLGYLDNTRNTVNPTEPNSKADKALDWFQGRGPEGPEPTTTGGKIKQGTANAINDGNAVNATGAVNWATDNATKATGHENWTYQGAIDGIGSNDESESTNFEYSEINGDSGICGDGSQGLQTD